MPYLAVCEEAAVVPIKTAVHQRQTDFLEYDLLAGVLGGRAVEGVERVVIEPVVTTSLAVVDEGLIANHFDHTVEANLPLTLIERAQTDTHGYVL